MAFKITCTNCTFEQRVQSEVVAQLTQENHETDTSNMCANCCDIEEVGVAMPTTETYT